jgi:hypothetical protein
MAHYDIAIGGLESAVQRILQSIGPIGRKR